MNAIKNYLHKTSFRLDIPNGNHTKSFQLNVQESSLPGMTMTSVNVMLNKQMKSTIAGTGMQFDPLSVRIILDERLDAYTDIIQWMVSTTDFKTNKSLHPSFMPKMVLVHIVDNAKKEIVCTFRYHDPFPVTMGSIDFSYSEDGNMAMQMDIQIAYKWFDIEKDGKVISTQSPEQAENISSIGLHPSFR